MQFTIHQLPKEEIRRGWVRIPENSRDSLSVGNLVIIKNKKNKVRRILLGTERNKEKGKHIYLDEPTRNELGITNNSDIDLEIKNPSIITFIFHQIIFYINHPDFITKFSAKVALLSLIISLISLILGVK